MLVKGASDYHDQWAPELPWWPIAGCSVAWITCRVHQNCGYFVADMIHTLFSQPKVRVCAKQTIKTPESEYFVGILRICHSDQDVLACLLHHPNIMIIHSGPKSLNTNIASQIYPLRRVSKMWSLCFNYHGHYQVSNPMLIHFTCPRNNTDYFKLNKKIMCVIPKSNIISMVRWGIFFCKLSVYIIFYTVTIKQFVPDLFTHLQRTPHTKHKTAHSPMERPWKNEMNDQKFFPQFTH